jgi:hypothetical protein
MESSSGKREVRISDVSEGGCFVDSITNMHDCENVSLKARMPTGEWIDLKGEVVSILPGIGFGVQFISLSEKEQKQLEQLILAKGGKLSSKSKMPIEKETNDTAKSADKKETILNVQNSSFNEFDDFIQDLFENENKTDKQ